MKQKKKTLYNLPIIQDNSVRSVKLYYELLEIPLDFLILKLVISRNKKPLGNELDKLKDFQRRK